MLKEKLGSGTPPLASLPLTGAWTSSRMSKNCPARKSVLEALSVQWLGAYSLSITHWSGGNRQPKVGHAPSRWNVCALVNASSEAATTIPKSWEAILTALGHSHTVGFKRYLYNVSGRPPLNNPSANLEAGVRPVPNLFLTFSCMHVCIRYVVA